MSRQGHHRLNASRSAANRARAELDRLNRAIIEAERRGDRAAQDCLTRQRANVLLNSLTS